jgi:hypothetical protein
LPHTRLAVRPTTPTAVATPRPRPAGIQQAPRDAAARDKQRSKTKIVTRTFANRQRITLPTTARPASPYPSTIDVNGLRNARILDVNLTLDGFSHEGYPRRVDVLLVAPDGRAALVMSDAGGLNAVEDLEITLDDQATTPLPETPPFTSGTFRPANYDRDPEAFPAPAPQGVTRSALATFKDARPNGRWTLFVIHDSIGYGGRISFGWSLTIKARITTRR